MSEASPERIIRHKVPSDTPTDRLDRYLRTVCPEISRSRIQKLIMEGLVQFRGRPFRKPSYHVMSGDEFVVQVPPPEISELKPEPIPLSILHEDDYLLVVDKPAGLVVHPGAGHAGGTLVNALLAHTARLAKRGGAGRLGLVHRLDKDTSGVMVVAKDDETHWNLSRQFADSTVKRVYIAAVRGVVRQDAGTIEAPIGRHPVQRTKMTIRHDSGRESLTQYKVMKRFKNATLLELYPQTGRTHQLRVHLASIGHPILGDLEYGVKGGFSRQALHAHRLGFRHPGIEQWVEFVSPLPKELEKSIQQML